MGEMFTISVYGRFRVEDSSGHDITPRGKKAQGLLALIASSSRMERGRSWLQDKLWSTREHTQGSASLRQSLNEIRRAFGENANILLAKHGAVALDPRFVKVCMEGAGEFLEGMDVRDPEFEAWLAQERGRNLAPSQTVATSPAMVLGAGMTGTPEKPVIHFVGSSSDVHEIAWGESLIIDSISRTVQEALSVDVYVGRSYSPSRGLQVKVHYTPQNSGQYLLRLIVENIQSGQRVWSTHRTFSAEDRTPTNDPELLQLINLAVDVIANSLSKPDLIKTLDLSPNSLCRLAIRKMFSMEEAQVAEADTLLAKAFDLDPKAIFISWRAQLRTIQKAERHNVDEDVLLESSRAFMSQAIEMEPHNSMVLAAVSNANLFLFHDIAAGHDIAKRSIAMNASNPLGWWAMSATKLYSGDTDTSYQMASLARRISVFSPFGFWWDLQKAAAAMVAGRFAEALNLFEQAHTARPEFRPPLRYMTALYAQDGQNTKAIQSAEKLIRLESDFSIKRMIEDDEYPASLLKRDIGFQMDRLNSLT